MSLAKSFVAAALLLFGSWTAQAADLTYNARRTTQVAVVDTSIVPACEDPAVERMIARHFRQKESGYWNSSLEIAGFDPRYTRQIAYRPWGPKFAVRRFCAAQALVNDGRARPVYYAVIEDRGIIGMSWGVEWCVVGLDRNFAYAPGCRMARP